MKSKPIVTTLTLDQRKDIKNAFDALDVSRSGTIELKDIKVALRALGFEPKKDEARMIIAELEKRSLDRGQLSKIQNGNVSLETFFEIMEFKLNEEDSRSAVLSAFETIRDGSAGISLDSLKQICSSVGLSYTEEELVMMIEEADKDHDGVINESEFMDILFSV